MHRVRSRGMGAQERRLDVPRASTWDVGQSETMTITPQSEGWRDGDEGVLPNTRRLRHSSLNGPASLESVKQVLCGNTNFHRPSRENHRAAIECNHAVVSPVTTLLKPGRPVAILWGVTGVIVSALNGKPSRPRPHVSVEILELKPALADFNSASAVMLPCFAVWVCAPRHYPLPDSVFLGVAQAVSCASSRQSLRVKTAARLGVSIPEIPVVNNYLFPAVAKANPRMGQCSAFRFACPSERFDGQSFKWFAGEILKSLVGWHRTGNNFGRFDVLTHIVFSGSRFLQGSGCCAFSL